MKATLAILLLVVLFSTGCGVSSSSSSSANTAPGPLSGNWQMSLQPTKGPNKVQSGFLIEQADALSGSMILIDPSCNGVGNVTGSVSGSNVSITFNPTGLAVNLTGTVGSGTMGGNYNILASGCSDTTVAPESGTWTANLVTPMNGNITNGSITSSRIGSFAITGGQISQGSNQGQSNAQLSGSVSFATNYCLSTANVSGSISGTTVTMNLVDPSNAPTQFGQITGTISLDGTTFSGTYKIVRETSGCPYGDSGVISFTL
jgi:hypothetical protein